MLVKIITSPEIITKLINGIVSNVLRFRVRKPYNF